MANEDELLRHTLMYVSGHRVIHLASVAQGSLSQEVQRGAKTARSSLWSTGLKLGGFLGTGELSGETERRTNDEQSTTYVSRYTYVNYLVSIKNKLMQEESISFIDTDAEKIEEDRLSMFGIVSGGFRPYRLDGSDLSNEDLGLLLSLILKESNAVSDPKHLRLFLLRARGHKSVQVEIPVLSQNFLLSQGFANDVALLSESRRNRIKLIAWGFIKFDQHHRKLRIDPLAIQHIF